MKRHVQTEGVRKWAGDHLIELQSEALRILDSFFAGHGSFILSGCAITQAGATYNVTPGLVVLEGLDYQGQAATMVVPFAGVSGVPLPVYLALDYTVRQRPYNDGQVRPISYDYYAKASTVKPGSEAQYLTLDANTLRYLDAVQDDKHRFITKAQLDSLVLEAPNDGNKYIREKRAWSKLQQIDFVEQTIAVVNGVGAISALADKTIYRFSAPLKELVVSGLAESWNPNSMAQLCITWDSDPTINYGTTGIFAFDKTKPKAGGYGEISIFNNKACLGNGQ